MIRYKKIESDLRYVFGCFPLSSLHYLRDHQDCLIRGNYTDGEGNGCLFWLLSRPLARELQIGCKQDLTRFFTGASGYPACESDEYQPARWLVRLVDGQVCDTVRERYGDVSHLDWKMMVKVLDAVIAEREAGERAAAETERRVAEKLGDRRCALAKAAV